MHIASLHLKEEASEWWEGTRLADHPGLNWEMFKAKMTDRFFSRAMRDEKHKEFMYPKTEGLKVTELATKFNHLLQYAGSDVTSEEQKIWHFHEWMGPDIKPWMVRHGCSTLEQYMDAAYKVEVTLEESTKKRDQQKLMQSQSQASGFKRPAPPSDFVKASKAKTEMTQGGSTQRSGQDKSPIRCFNCGTAGHKSSVCQQEKRVCFGCGREGHMQKFCRQREQQETVFHQGSVNQNSQPRFRPVEAPSPSMQTTAQNKGKAPVASGSHGQRLYVIREADGPDVPFA